MKSQAFTLKNGLRFVVVDTKAFPTLSALLLVGAGSRYENKINNGVAHFFEHMAFKGSKKYPNSFVIASTIEGLGGVFNAFTAKDHTGYWIKATNEHFVTLVDVLSDMVLSSFLLEEEIQREKGVIVEELNLYEDTPYRKVGELFENLLYRDNPLGFDIGGTKSTVTKFSRDTFVDYMNQLYHPKNAVFVVAGSLNDIDKYKEIVEEKFSNWQDGKKAECDKVIEKQEKPQIILRHKKTEQTHFVLGFRAYPFTDKRRYELLLLSAILGGGMASRLFIEVRERRGLCYYISTQRELYYDVGNFYTSAGITNDIDKVKEAIEVILKEHKKISQGEVKQEQLSMAKELVKGRLLLSLEDSFNLANFYGSRLLLEEEVISPQQVINNIEKVRLEDVILVAQDIFKPEKLNFALIGPYEKKEEFESVLTI